MCGQLSWTRLAERASGHLPWGANLNLVGATVRSIALLFLALTAGCASMTKPPADASPATAAAPPAASAPATATPSKKAGAQKAPVAGAAKPAPTAPATPAPAAAKADAAPHLDLKGLEQRLKDTKAVGIFTKLALKNKVDDLLDKFRAYHNGQQPPTLTDLRPNYELLIMKVLSLLQKDDPALADDVARSREAIWGVLADKNKFALI